MRFYCRLRNPFCRNLSRKWRTFSRTPKPGTTRSRPTQSITLSICNRDYRVVKRRMHVSDAIGDGPLAFSNWWYLSHTYFLIRRFAPLRVRAFVRVR